MFRCFGGWGILPIPPDERREMYILDVKTPGKLLNHRGRQIRTPAQFPIMHSELKKFEVMLRQVGVTEYKIRSKEEVDKEIAARQSKESVDISPTDHEVVIEEIMDSEEETKSVLDKLIRDAEKEK
jgi:hypothetical protein